MPSPKRRTNIKVPAAVITTKPAKSQGGHPVPDRENKPQRRNRQKKKPPSA